jgi:hypothetical protein
MNDATGLVLGGDGGQQLGHQHDVASDHGWRAASGHATAVDDDVRAHCADDPTEVASIGGSQVDRMTIGARGRARDKGKIDAVGRLEGFGHVPPEEPARSQDEEARPGHVGGRIVGRINSKSVFARS